MKSDICGIQVPEERQQGLLSRLKRVTRATLQTGPQEPFQVESTPLDVGIRCYCVLSLNSRNRTPRSFLHHDLAYWQGIVERCSR